MAKEKMTLKAYHWNKGNGRMEKKPKDTRYDMPHTDENTTGNVPSYGMPTTLTAYNAMVKRYQDAAATDDTIFSKLLCVTFSKTSIFRILSQEGCEAIRIWQALPNGDEKVSFVLEGLNENYRPLKEEIVLQAAKDGEDYVHDEGDPFYEERGNGKEEGGLAFLNQQQIASQSLSQFMEALFTAFAKK